MTRSRLFFVITLSALANGAAAQEVLYLGRGATESVIVEDSSHRVHELRTGDSLDDVGELKDIKDDEIVFDRVLRDDEREQLKSLGLAVPDVRRMRVARRAERHAVRGNGAAPFRSE